MRQKKNFFVKNNTLNKGNTISDNKEQNTRPSFKPDLIAEFESLDPTNAEKLVELAKKEQEHEHKMEELRLNMDQRAKRMGRVCALFTILAICFFTYNMVLTRQSISALIFALISFGAVLMLSCKHKSSCTNCGGNMGNNRHYKNRLHTRNEGQNSTSTNDNKDYKARNRNYHNRFKSKQQS
jgi:uncharacterized membrane protein